MERNLCERSLRLLSIYWQNDSASEVFGHFIKPSNFFGLKLIFVALCWTVHRWRWSRPYDAKLEIHMRFTQAKRSNEMERKNTDRLINYWKRERNWMQEKTFTDCSSSSSFSSDSLCSALALGQIVINQLLNYYYYRFLCLILVNNRLITNEIKCKLDWSMAEAVRVDRQHSKAFD